MASTAAGPRVEFRRVTKRYGDVVAVNQVSFTIEQGTLVTLLGRRAAARPRPFASSRGWSSASEGESSSAGGTSPGGRPPTGT
jgi:iron(III) transport system ATP-binding protein